MEELKAKLFDIVAKLRERCAAAEAEGFTLADMGEIDELSASLLHTYLELMRADREET